MESTEKNVERNTIQKIKILDYVRSVKTHPTAEEVFENVRKEIPSITLATVYRNLNQLSEKGVISRLEINHEFRYDYMTQAHVHIVCKDSGEVIDVLDKTTNELLQKLLSKIKRKKIIPNTVNIFVYGDCHNK